MSNLPKINVESAECTIEIVTDGQALRLGIARSCGGWWCYPSFAILDYQLKAKHIENDMEAGGDWYVHGLSCIELDEVIRKMKLFIHAAEQIKAGYDA